MTEKELCVPYSELGRLEVGCRKCGTAFVINLGSSNLPPLGGGRDFARQCAVCLAPFPEATLAALILYQRFLLESRKGDLDIRFRIKTG
ncbi:MAG TPA: hypothetical protein VI455_03045 [Terriglobia bacterium]